jgi:outer membrane biosynthesis protein TonB
MARSSACLLVLAAAVFAAVALSACGDSGADLLPGKTASEIEANLDEVARLAGEGECVGAEDAAQEVSAEVDALGGVDAKLKQALGEGASRLNEVVAGCEEEPAEEEELEPVEPEEEVESAEKPKKGKKAEKPEKPEKEAPEKEAEEPAEEATPPSNGKGKGAENGQGPEGTGPPGLTEPPSGGVGPGTEVEGGGD